MNSPEFYCRKKSALHLYKNQQLLNSTLDVIKQFFILMGAKVTDDREHEELKEPCTKQCFECMADVGETRIKNKKVS